MDQSGNKCGCMHHYSVGVIVILFGALFLLGNMGVVTKAMVDMGWPILVIAGGISKLCGKMMCKCC